MMASTIFSYPVVDAVREDQLSAAEQLLQRLKTFPCNSHCKQERRIAVQCSSQPDQAASSSMPFSSSSPACSPYKLTTAAAAHRATDHTLPVAALCICDHGKMSMIDVLTRVDAICKKYDRYDTNKHRNDAGGGDPFCRLYAAVEKSERAAREKNRASAVTLNADVRRTKARLMEEVIKLQKLAIKKTCTGERALTGGDGDTERSGYSIAPIGSSRSLTEAAADQNGGWSGGNARPGMKFDFSGQRAEHYFRRSGLKSGRGHELRNWIGRSL